MRSPKHWTKAEDDILRNAVDGCVDNEQTNWNDVALKLEGRSNKDCRKRWVYSLAPLIKKGHWDETEDVLLREGVRLHGTSWAAVASVVGTRQADQCSRKWHEVMKPNINRDRWSLWEDEILKNAVRAHGRKWIEVVERYFPDRTPIATMKRYSQLHRNIVETAN